MNTLPTSQRHLPDGLTLEKPAKSLASLAATESLDTLKTTVVAQWKFTEQFAALAKHGIRPIDRVLFHGPPGNGKTMACQWLASQIDVPLYRVRCEVVVEPYVGRTAANISAIMQWLERQGRCIVLFDEVEQIMISREDSGGSYGREFSSAMGVFWQFLDRWEAPTLFILATNLPGRLDAALLSRIDLQMEFGPPTPEQAGSVVHYWQEVLHQYGGETWGPELRSFSGQWDSFRELFQAIQHRVRMHVTGNGKGKP